MRPERSVFVHLGLLGAAAVLAVGVWTRDKAPKAMAQSEVTVWSGRPGDVTRIDYEGKTKKVALERKEDKQGAYLVGTVEKSAAPPKPAADPDAEPEEQPEAPPGAPTTTTVVSVGAGQKLLDALAPLKALRAIGKVPDDRAAEFGLGEPEGSLTVGYKSGPRKLVIGGPTPGGADRYVRDEASGEVYVLKGDVYRDLDSAEQRLVERDLHEWKEPEIAKAKISAGGKAREVVRGGSGDGKKFWADGASPGTNDETVGNWISKLDRLRPTEYVLAAPEGQESVVRVDYASSGNPSLGYVELVKVPAKDGGKAEWYVTSERLRAYGKVAANNAEQVEQDIGAVVK
ncbi:MAG: DUF4340 domain-containing protein [Polyangiaceae bacterium]